MKLDRPAVSVHAVTGELVGIVECPDGVMWSRELSEVSRCSVTAAAQDITTQIVPLEHWVAVWHGQRMAWFGEIQDNVYSDQAMTLEAKDVSTLMWHTRVQSDRAWNQLDVAPIAADLWRDMLRHHGIDGADPEVLPALAQQSRFSYQVKADQRMVHQEMEELTKIGLRWTVVAGRPIIGLQPGRITAELADCDFTVGMQIRRSGQKTANDVRVQGKNYAWTERKKLGSLRRQSLVSLDDLFGAENIRRAAAEQIRQYAVIRDELVVPQGATLSPDAPVELDDLVPGALYAVTALGVRTILQLEQVQVAASPGGVDVQVTMAAVDREILTDRREKVFYDITATDTGWMDADIVPVLDITTQDPGWTKVVCAQVDVFNRANNASLGAAWVTLDQAPAVNTNRAQAGTAGANSTTTFFAARRTGTVCSDSQEVQFTVVTPAGTAALALGGGAGLRANSAGTQRVEAIATNSRLSIYTRISGTAVERAFVNVTVNSGAVLLLRAVGNVYTLFMNGVSQVTWTDTGNLVPTSNRYGVLALFASKDFFGAQSFGWAVDDFTHRDG